MRWIFCLIILNFSLLKVSSISAASVSSSSNFCLILLTRLTSVWAGSFFVIFPINFAKVLFLPPSPLTISGGGPGSFGSAWFESLSSAFTPTSSCFDEFISETLFDSLFSFTAASFNLANRLLPSPPMPIPIGFFTAGLVSVAAGLSVAAVFSGAGLSVSVFFASSVLFWFAALNPFRPNANPNPSFGAGLFSSALPCALVGSVESFEVPLLMPTSISSGLTFPLFSCLVAAKTDLRPFCVDAAAR